MKTIQFSPKILKSLFLALVLIIALIQPAMLSFKQAFPLSALASPAADFTVNIASDPGPASCTALSCSLRAAITAANTGGKFGVHTIDFALTYPVTITLSSPLPAITGTLTLNGPGAANLSISGAGLYRILATDKGATLNLSGLAFRNGFDTFAGGGIFNDHGTMAISTSLVDGNLAGGGDGGGLNNDGGKVIIHDSTFKNNNAFHDGGISNSGVITITDSLFSDNLARTGGAIDNNGTLTVESSTFSGNTAPQIRGGAIRNGGTLTVANSTFFNNGSTGGADIDNDNGVAHITNGTFANAILPSVESIANHGASAVLTIRNSIIASGIGIQNCTNFDGGTLNADASNQSTDATCGSAGVVTLTQLSLAPLGNYGGPTPTIALFPGSVAIDAGNDAVCAAALGSPSFGAGGVDQRGVTRPQGAHCDVGAFEQLPIRSIDLPIMFK